MTNGFLALDYRCRKIGVENLMTSGDQKDLPELVQLLMDGQLEPSTAYHVIHEVGRARLVEAVPVVEPFLTSLDPTLRSIALEVLLQHFGVTKYVETATHFLLNDPDTEVRFRAASALGARYRNTRDRDSLRTLAGVVRNEREEEFVREAAYGAMKEIVRYDPKEQFALASRGFKPTAGIDREFVAAHA